ncbi:glyoxalase [Gordonia sp. HNM0687]|uniref:Glyoxalase n=1 Tax=Gordonia mangrovi TaxID=2665643 RepID=A0A6L7GVJ9_9ACTN|nr:VOC family protein [Gordonia mangrovi]MXP24006.1 glyoxalase [Gordonia mangrovi]UVF76550.1 VOC family protein [Gordonia mangrovi]
MATATISSMLLSSDDPKRLARWYAAVFEAEIQTDPDAPGYEIMELDGFHIMFDQRDDVSGRNVGGARQILNVEVDDPVATAARIDASGAEWISPLEDKGGGSYFGTLTDPDGNWLQIVRISDELEAQMSAPTSAYSSFAVCDLDAAATFYRDVLGMRVLRLEMGVLGVRINRTTTVLVYPKPDHRPAGFTVLNIPVPDLEQAVDDLVARGVEFLRYDHFEHDERGIARGGDDGPDLAWFADPSGNVLALQQK